MNGRHHRGSREEFHENCTGFSLRMGNEQADAGRDGRTRLARPNSQPRTGTGKFSFSLFSRPREGLATLPGWSILLFCYYYYIMWWPLQGKGSFVSSTIYNNNRPIIGVASQILRFGVRYQLPPRCLSLLLAMSSCVFCLSFPPRGHEPSPILRGHLLLIV